MAGVGRVSLSALRAASRAGRAYAKRKGLDPVTVTRAVSDTVREGVGNFASPGVIDDALKGTARWFDEDLAKFDKETETNVSGFMDDVMDNVDFLWGAKRSAKTGMPRSGYLPRGSEYRLPGVPRGTVVNDIAKKRSRRSARGAM